MGADHRVLGARIGLAAIVVAVAAAIVLLAVVHRGEAVDQLADRLRQRLVGEIHVREHGVAAAVGRHRGEMQNRAHRWLGIARHV